MRTSRLTLPEDFDEFDSLIDESKFYELNILTKEIENLLHKKRKLNPCDCNTNGNTSSSSSLTNGNLITSISKNKKQAFIRSMFNNNGGGGGGSECVYNNSNETNDLLLNESNTKSLSYLLNGIMNKSNRHNNNDNESDSCKILILNHTENNLYISGESSLIKSLLPEIAEDNVSDHIRLNSSKYTTKFLFDSFNIHHIEFMERLYNNDFVMEACYGGGLEGQQFNEYIFVKCKK
jgi:hypothetical protein